MFVSCHSAIAQELQSEHEIESALKSMIQTQVDTEYSKYRNLDINVRLASGVSSLAQCKRSLHIEPPAKVPLGNVRWKVECTGEWSLTAKTATSVDVYMPVSSEKLKRGTLLDKSNIKMDWVSLRYPKSIYALKTDLVGLKLVRSMNSGDSFTNRHIGIDFDVIKNEDLVIVYKSGGFEIQANGKAQESAQIGGKIRVINTSSNKELIGTLTQQGVVEVY